jgi:hypothetical protein
LAWKKSQDFLSYWQLLGFVFCQQEFDVCALSIWKIMGFLGSELIEPSNISIGHTGRSVAAGVFNVSFFSILPFEDDPKWLIVGRRSDQPVFSKSSNRCCNVFFKKESKLGTTKQNSRHRAFMIPWDWWNLGYILVGWLGNRLRPLDVPVRDSERTGRWLIGGRGY